jgi:vancomycin resistance protein YoaR
MKNLLTVLWFFAIVLVLAALSLVGYDYSRTRDAFPPRSFISGVDVSLLTQQESIKKLKQLPLSELLAPSITLEADSKKFSFPPAKLGIRVLYAESIERAFIDSHRGNYLHELKKRLAEGVFNSPLMLDVGDNTLKPILEMIAKEIRSEPRDASIRYDEETGGYNIKSDDPGRELNVNRSLVRFKMRLGEGQTIIPLVLDYTTPKISEKALRDHPPAFRLSAYTTYYGSHDDPNRIHNIKLVASWIDGTVLMPGDIFSVAQILGDVTEERGFREAYVIMQNELVPQLGGGSCQIATTLFNAVSLADLKIVQRRNHSFYFNIYPLGRDAAVYPGQVDMVFENDSGYPILLKAVATNKRLSFRVYGTPNGKTVKFTYPAIFARNESGQFVPSSVRYVLNNDVPFRTEITKTVVDKEGKKLKEEALVSHYKLYGDKENVPIRKPGEEN